MGVSKLDIYGNPYLGVLCRASEGRVLVPNNISHDTGALIAESLKAELVPMLISASSVLGSLCAINSRGLLLPHYAFEDDYRCLKAALEIGIVPSKLTALGNNVLANDRKALIHPDFDPVSKKTIADVLDVEVMEGTIAGIDTVGSAAYVTNKGLLVHPKTTETELAALKGFFGLPIKKTTANYGTPFIGACLIANSKGAAIGSLSTGIEMGNIEDSLDLIQAPGEDE